MANVGVARPAGRFEPHVRELVDEDLQGDAVLKPHGGQRADHVHETADGAAFFGHRDEQFARLAVLEHPDGDVTFVFADGELVRDRLSRVRQVATDRLTGRFRALLTIHFFGGCQRLALLRAIAIDGQRFQTELPTFEVGVLDVLDGRVFRHVHRFGNGPGEERLGGGHHVDVCPP